MISSPTLRYDTSGMKLTSHLKLDAYAAAEVSPFNVNSRNAARAGGSVRHGGGNGGGGGGGGGGGPGFGGGGGGGKKLGSVDDIRGPECKSCG